MPSKKLAKKIRLKVIKVKGKSYLIDSLEIKPDAFFESLLR